MTRALNGSINENRRHFCGTNLTGSVHFGRSWRGIRCKQTKQAVKVQLDDGRRAWGTYTDPKNVTLKFYV